MSNQMLDQCGASPRFATVACACTLNVVKSQWSMVKTERGGGLLSRLYIAWLT